MSIPSTDPYDCNYCGNKAACDNKSIRLSLLENIIDYSNKDPIPKDCNLFIDDGDRDYNLYFGQDEVD